MREVIGVSPIDERRFQVHLMDEFGEYLKTWCFIYPPIQVLAELAAGKITHDVEAFGQIIFLPKEMFQTLLMERAA